MSHLGSKKTRNSCSGSVYTELASKKMVVGKSDFPFRKAFFSGVLFIGWVVYIHDTYVSNPPPPGLPYVLPGWKLKRIDG